MQDWRNAGLEKCRKGGMKESSIFYEIQKLVLHEVLENFVRKNLECQP